MNSLDDSSRESYRRDLLAELLHERHPVIPWAEKHRKPMPLAYAVFRMRDTKRRCAERQRVLIEALDGNLGHSAPPAERRAA